MASFETTFQYTEPRANRAAGIRTRQAAWSSWGLAISLIKSATALAIPCGLAFLAYQALGCTLMQL